MNDLFTAPSLTSGVYMRSTDVWELWCDGVCYKGRVNCIISSLFVSHRVGVKHNKFAMEVLMGPPAGVVFNSTAAAAITKCLWWINGGTNHNYNGGCGCSAPMADLNCQSPNSPFRNVAPGGGYVTPDSPETVRCMCNGNVQSNSTCFWRGPAFNTSTGPFGTSDLEQFVEQRMYVDAVHGGYADIWDEATLDGHGAGRLMAADPASFIVAIYYEMSSGERVEGLEVAKRLQQQLLDQHGVAPPIVGVDRSITVSAERGPFVEYEPAASEAPSSSLGSTLSTIVV